MLILLELVVCPLLHVKISREWSVQCCLAEIVASHSPGGAVVRRLWRPRCTYFVVGNYVNINSGKEALRQATEYTYYISRYASTNLLNILVSDSFFGRALMRIFICRLRCVILSSVRCLLSAYCDEHVRSVGRQSLLVAQKCRVLDTSYYLGLMYDESIMCASKAERTVLGRSAVGRFLVGLCRSGT